MTKKTFSGQMRRIAWSWFLVLATRSAMAATVTGSANEVGPNVQHPNGQIYDQVLLTGASATVKCDPGQVVRTSFIDLNDDIVQVEFSGAGTLTFALDGASGPAAPLKYNQPGVSYMKGHASLTVEGFDSFTNISVYSVGSATPGVNTTLFRTGEVYDGIADLQRITIVSNRANPNSSVMASIRAGNAHFWGTTGPVGIGAANVRVENVVTLGDLWTEDAAVPVLSFGLGSQFGAVTVAGGNLLQRNGKTILATGYRYDVNPAEGRTSHDRVLPMQWPRAQLLRDNGVVETLPTAPPGGWF